MRGITLIILLFFIVLRSTAQDNIHGVVLDGDTMEPLQGASVVLRDSNGKMKKFTSSDQKGEFSLILSALDNGHSGYTLDISMLSYAKQTLALDSIEIPLQIIMVPESTLLKEVAVKAQRVH